jgi:SOS response regulatory protein OraA/RecX
MLLNQEWNWDDALEVAKEEGREEGENKKARELLTLIEKGYSAEQLRSVLTLGEAEPEYQ